MTGDNTWTSSPHRCLTKARKLSNVETAGWCGVADCDCEITSSTTSIFAANGPWTDWSAGTDNLILIAFIDPSRKGDCVGVDVGVEFLFLFLLDVNVGGVVVVAVAVVVAVVLVTFGMPAKVELVVVDGVVIVPL